MSHRRRNIIGGVVVAILVVAVVIIMLPRPVTVLGTVTTSGSGTYATGIVFTGSSGKTYSAGVSNGKFSISLANPGTYSIQVNWAGAYSWQGDIADVPNPLKLNVGLGGASTVSENISLRVPDSSVTLTGTASANATDMHPVEMIFIGSVDDLAYTTKVLNGTFSITLPNSQAYIVMMTENGLQGYAGTCNAGSLNVYVSAGSSSAQVGAMSC